jgi:radical SAM superfamily enzyme YgiQ (UPF0313 family)
MKILLVNPPTRESDTLNLGLAMIASILRTDGHEIEVLDAHLLGLNEDQIKNEFQRRSYEVLGIGGLSNSFRCIRRIIHLSKLVHPQIPVVAGNMVVTASPSLFMKYTEADVAVVDEGETTAVELFRALQEKGELRKINGLWLRDGQGSFPTAPRERILDLDGLPFPAWDLFPMDLFFRRKFSTFGFALNISTTRGCPYDCHYCSRSFGRKVTYRSAESMLSEIIWLKKCYPLLNHIVLGDDLFMTHKKRNERFCELMIEKKPGITWSTSARVNLVDEKTLKLMRKAGCIHVGFGLESGSQMMLDAMNKCVTVEQAEQAMQIVRRAGFPTGGSFIIGYPGETRETLKETLDFIRRAKLPPVKFFFATPYPGTHLYGIARNRGLIPDELQFLESLFENSEDLLVNFTQFTAEELIRLKKWAERKTFRSAPFMTKLTIWWDWFLVKCERARARGVQGSILRILKEFGFARKNTAGIRL